MKNVVLVGLMASGKSTVGRLLARALGRPFIDTDDAIARRAGRPVAAIFAEQGEVAFRELERSVIAQLAVQSGLIIATGGGAVLHPANRDALRQNGFVFWLEAAPAELYERARNQGLTARPLLAGDDPLGRLTALAQARAEAYGLAAHYRIDAGGKDAAAVAAEILAILHDKGDQEHAGGTRQPW